MAAPKDLITVLELTAEKVPASAGTDMLRYSESDEANASTYEGGYHEGRLRVIGTVERGLSSPSGEHWLAQASVDMDDTDHTWRARKDVSTTKFTSGRDAVLKIYSPTARAAATPATVRFRGKIRQLPFLEGLGARWELEELIGSEYGPFYLDRPLQPRKFRRELFPEIDPDLLDQIVPLVVGEVSDKGAKDRLTGEDAEKGLCPGFFVGMKAVSSNETVQNTVRTQTVLPPPPAPRYEKYGAGGSSTWQFAGVTVTTLGGRTTLGGIATISGLPDDVPGAGVGGFSNSNGVRLYFETSYTPEQLNQCRWISIYVRRAGTTQWHSLDASDPPDNDGVFFHNVNGDDDFFKLFGPAIPTRNNAFVTTTTIVNGTEVVINDYGLIIFAAHACGEFIDVFGSDNAEEGPQRVRWDTAAMVASGSLLMPGLAGWPFPNTYIDLTDEDGVTERFYGLLIRGPLLEHHRTGQVTIAANICGMEDVGDGTGDLIDQAFRQWKHLLNAFVFANEGKGYYTGNWPADATFVDGTPAIRSESVTAAENQGIEILGSAKGYLGGFCLTEDITVREFLRRFNLTFTSFSRCTAEGQIAIGLIDLKALPSSGALFREDIDDVIQLGAPVERMDLVENRIEFKYDWDADGQRYRSDREVYESVPSQIAYGAGGRKSVRQRELYQQFCTRDATTARAAMLERLGLLQWAPVEVPLITGFCGYEVEAGDRLRVSGHEGLGAYGYVLRPMLVMRQSDRLSDGACELMLWDMGPIAESFYGPPDETGAYTENLTWGSTATSGEDWGSTATSGIRWG